jgi:hypothetical protein
LLFRGRRRRRRRSVLGSVWSMDGFIDCHSIEKDGM